MALNLQLEIALEPVSKPHKLQANKSHRDGEMAASRGSNTLICDTDGYVST